MKKILFSLLALCFANFAFAQWTTSGSNIYYNNGNVGIGVANPIYKLDVKGNGWIGNGLNNGVYIGNGNHAIWTRTGGTYGKLVLYSGNADRLTIDGDNGNIGIGITSPSAPLQIRSGFQDIRFLTGTNTSGYMLDIGVNDNGVNFHNNSTIRGYNFTNATNDHLFIIKPDGNVGVGTTSPEYKLDVAGSFRSTSVQSGLLFNDLSGQAILGLDGSDGDFTGGDYAYFLHDGTNLKIINHANEAMVIANNGNVGIGATNLSEKLNVNGTIRSKKVKVEATGWPDFVFATNYKLRTLNELEAYIKTNKHFPEVPSAKEIEENGLDLGKMAATLLQKVEELTLYTIEQEKKITQQAKENQELKTTLQEVLKRIEKLESDGISPVGRTSGAKTKNN